MKIKAMAITICAFIIATAGTSAINVMEDSYKKNLNQTQHRLANSNAEALTYLTDKTIEQTSGTLLPSDKLQEDRKNSLMTTISLNSIPDFVPGEFIVKFHSNVFEKVTNSEDAITLTSVPYVNSLNEQYHIATMQKVFKGRERFSDDPFGLTYIYKFILTDKGSDILSIIQDYEKDSNVEYAEPNYIYYTSGIPNDPDFDEKWGLHNTGQTGGTPDADIDAPEAWDLETGSSDVIIAIVDTGVDYDHPDLINNIWINENETPDNGYDDDNNGYIDDYYGYDFCELGQVRDHDPMDEHGHGTHCSGIAGAVTNNSIGVSGVSWNCKIMSIRFINAEGWGTDIDAAASLVYAADNGADIISNSWGSYSPSQTLKNAIDYAAEYSILVAAAGNANSYCKKLYPATYENVIAVAATDKNDEKAEFVFPHIGSNYGDYSDAWIDVSAPGDDIYSTYLDNTYWYLSGTSMATPMVAGLLGLVKSYYPTWNNDFMIGHVLSTADNIDNLNPDYEGLLGTGRINTYNALTVNPQTSIIFKKYIIDDSEGDNDGYLDPGEAIELDIILRNNWLNATNVEAVLSTSNNQITITSANADFGNLSTLERSTNVFSLNLDSIANYSQLIDFDLTVTADGGYEVIIPVKIEVPYKFQDGWPVVSEDMASFTAPVLGNLDGDDSLEIVMVDKDALVYAYNHDGSDVEGWPVDVYPYRLDNHPALADIDEDGKDEIFVPSIYPYSIIGRIWGFDDDGSHLSGWPQDIPCWIGGEASPSIGDLDNDGDLEIVISAHEYPNGYVYAWHHNGTMMNGWPVEIPDESFDGTTALVDIDDDNDLEIFAVAKKVYSWHHNGSDVQGFPADSSGPGTTPKTSPAIADLDNDGELEIIAAIRHLSVLDTQGNILWTKDSGILWQYSTPAIGDIDGDGDLEIVTYTHEAGGGEVDNLYAYHHNGNLVTGWPISKEVIHYLPSWNKVVLGDIDGDGDAEVIISSYDDLYVFNSDTTLVDDFPILRYGGNIPTLGDIDNDGDVEIVVGSDRGYVFDCNEPYFPFKMPWPTFQHDPQHSGLYTSLFLLEGHCNYEDMGPADNVTIDIINIDTGRKWEASTVDNYYYLTLNPGEDINASEILRLIAKDNTSYVNVTDHIITQNEIDEGSISIDMILDEYSLDLVDFPMYLAEVNNFFDYDQLCGAAVVQMNVDYMRWNKTLDPDGAPTWCEDHSHTQANLLASNVSGTYYTADEMDAALDALKGDKYNFGVYQNSVGTDILADICYWIDYEPTHDPGYPDHVPGAIPVYGDYSNWMSIRGIHTDADPSEPVPPFTTVHGIWVNDPLPSGIGENTYKMASEWLASYYSKLNVPGDPYDDMFVAVCEPPAGAVSDVELVETTQYWDVQLPDPQGGGFLHQIFDSLIIYAATTGAQERVCPYDEQFADVFEQSYPGRPMLVKNLVVGDEKHDFYITPYNDKPISFMKKGSHSQPDEEKTLAAVIVNAETGQFQETSWVNEPVKYLKISESDAREIVYDILVDMGINPDDLPARAIQMDLVYRGGYSPFHPEYRAIIPMLDLVFYISSIDGTVNFTI